MKNILIAVELKDQAFNQQIIQAAQQLAICFKAKCWIIHIAAPEPDFVGYEVGPQYIRDVQAEDLREDHRSLQKIASELEKAGISAEALLIQGPTEEMILKEVEKLNIDLVVLGNKKHSNFYSTFIGSVTDDLVQDLDIPIYLIPKKQ